MYDVGVDLAWGDRSPTGLAVLDDEGRLVAAGQVRSDADILAWLSPWVAGACLVAIDAPIVVRNSRGARPCERLVGRYFARFHASCHPANTTNPAFADGGRAHRLTRALGLDLDPVTAGPGRQAPRRAVEVYPHTALVCLFELPTVLTYKNKPGRDLHHLRGQMLRLVGHLESLAGAAVVLDVTSCPDWPRLRAGVEGAATKATLRSVEDTLDAVVCAYVARYARLAPHAVRALGTDDAGYILTPVTPAIAAAVDADRRAGIVPGRAPAPGRSARR